MRRFLILARKEAAGILLSPPILFAAAFFVLLDSVAFALALRETPPLAVFDDIALFMLFISVVMFPLISMQSFAEDNASGTLETLLTAPIGGFSVVLAKYAGAMAFALLYLSHGVVYALLLSYGGNLDWRSAATALAALVAVASLAISLGVFVSALAVSPAAAAAGTGGVLILMALASELDPHAGAVAGLVHSLGFLPHAKRLVAGQMGTGAAVYFASLTALFLFYAWLALNAREGDRSAPDPVARRRLAAARALAAVGCVLLLVQVAVLHIGGVWEYGFPLSVDWPRVPRAWLLPSGLAAVSFAWALWNFVAARGSARRAGHRERESEPEPESGVESGTETKLEPGPEGAGAGKAPGGHGGDGPNVRLRVVLAALAALVVVLNLNWLSRYPFGVFAGSAPYGFLAQLRERTWDVSDDGRNSLAPDTRRLLDSLQGGAQFTSFIPGDFRHRDVPVAEELRRLLERCAEYTPRVSFAFADAKNDPERAARLARELGLEAEKPEELLVLDYQGRRFLVPATTLAAPPDWRRSAAGGERWVFDGENRLARALRRLLDPRAPNVYFTHGHQELSLEGGAYPERSASRLVRAMAGANMRVRLHAIASSGPVPADCDILVVAAPRRPFLEGEAGEIERYLEGGGRLLVLAPPAAPEAPAGEDPLNRLLFALGGDVRDDVVEDGRNNHNGQALSPLGKTRGGGDSGPRAVFTLARSIRDNPRSPENGWSVERMIESHPTAVALSPAGGAARPGPFTLMYRAAKDGARREARVVVMASGRMAADSDIGRGDNEGVVMGMLQWLAGYDEGDEAPPRPGVDRRIGLDGPHLRGVLWVGLAGLPLAWILAGVFVWWARRD